MEPDDIVHHRGGGLLKAQLPGRRLPEAGVGRTAGGGEDGRNYSRQRGQPLEHQHRRVRSFGEIERVASLPHRPA